MEKKVDVERVAGLGLRVRKSRIMSLMPRAAGDGSVQQCAGGQQIRANFDENIV